MTQWRFFMAEPTHTDVTIIGAGAIGLSIGWRLAQAGRRVTLFEREKAGQGTSWLAAGMLAPAVEIGFEELDLYALGRQSLSQWPGFAAELEKVTGQDIDYRSNGTLVVADDPDRAAALRRLYDFQRTHNVPVEWLRPAEALDVEPFLAPRLAAAVYSPDDHQLDNRRLIHALRTAFEQAGGTLHEDTPVQAVVPNATHSRVVTAAGEICEAGIVIVAAGVWSRQVEGLVPHPPEIRPVKGQMIELKIERPFDLQHVVRGPDAYLAPKSDGRLLVGATTEEMGFDTTVTAGGLYTILEGAWTIVPGVYDLPVTDTWAGLRPASRDHAPLLGASGVPGVMYATGHYRHGILLTPVTAQAITRLVLTGEPDPLMAAFAPERFQPIH